MRVNRPVVLEVSVLQLDHVEDGWADNFAEQSVLVVKLAGLAHREEKLEKKKNQIKSCFVTIVIGGSKIINWYETKIFCTFFYLIFMCKINDPFNLKNDKVLVLKNLKKLLFAAALFAVNLASMDATL